MSPSDRTYRKIPDSAESGISLCRFSVLFVAKQRDRHVVHVRAGRPRHDQASCLLQCVIGVVVLQHGIHGQPMIRKFPAGIPIGVAARRVRRAVRSVAPLEACFS